MPDDLNFHAAFDYYQDHIYRSDFFTLLESHNLKISGSIPSVAWELFGSILTGQKGVEGYGTDLDGIEIKSAKTGSGFEYQYHLNSGLEKLEEDMQVDHFFCCYSSDYSNVKVYHLPGEELAPDFFAKWIPLYKKNYSKKVDKSKRRQRFRKSVSNGFVTQNGTCVMEIENRSMIHPFVRREKVVSFWKKLFR